MKLIKLMFLLLFYCMNIFAESEPATLQKVEIAYVYENLGETKLHFLQISGLENSFVEQKINDTIVEKANIENLRAMASSGYDSGTNVSCSAYLLGDEDSPKILSTLMSVSGRLSSGRNGHEYFPLMFNLESGDIIPSDELFSENAQEKLDDWLYKNILEQSTYYNIEHALPVPLDNAILTDTGVLIAYPVDTFKFLYNTSAAFHFYYYEIIELLNKDNVLISGIDILKLSDKKEEIDNISKGLLPGVPNIIGSSINEVTKKYYELTDSERFLSGERYVLEAPEFRDIYPIVSSDSDTISGILAKRMSIGGLNIGISTKEDCVSTLGEAIAVLPLEGASASQYYMPEGELSIYFFGEYKLMLSTDKQDILRTIYIEYEGDSAT
jgi:hypothetical protein